MANIKIRLVVKTRKITQINKNSKCFIIDNLSKAKPKEKPNNHCTKVDQAQTIEWSGLPLKPELFDQVSIDSIVYEASKPKKGKKEKDLFGVSFLTGVNGVIYGTVIAKNLKPIDEEAYTINFTVIKADGSSTSYCVDPKLKVNPT